MRLSHKQVIKNKKLGRLIISSPRTLMSNYFNMKWGELTELLKPRQNMRNEELISGLKKMAKQMKPNEFDSIVSPLIDDKKAFSLKQRKILLKLKSKYGRQLK